MLDFHVDWYCPSCGLEERTKPKPNRFHHCPKLGGLTTPLIRKGVSAKHDVRLRDDYAGQEKVRLDDQGRPVMSIVTTRDNGQDVTVFAPTATARGETHGLVG